MARTERLLTPRQQLFVQEYLLDLNATQAAIRAGYSPKTARQAGAENLTKPVIAAAIRLGQERRSERTQISADRVLNELGRIGFADIRQCFTEAGALKPVTAWTEDLAAAVASVEVVEKPGPPDGAGNRNVERVHKIKMLDKNTALERIGKHLGMFIERHEHSVAPFTGFQVTPPKYRHAHRERGDG